MMEIRLHGRGGQGVVTAAYVLSWAAFFSGHEIRSFPIYGPERRGAPVAAFLRLDNKPVRLRCQIYNPDCVAVFDARLPFMLNVFAGLKAGGSAILNTGLNAETAIERLHLENSSIGKLGVLDAVAIAREMTGSPIVNSVMLGSFSKVIDSLPFDAVVEGIKKVFKEETAAERNVRAAQAGYERTIVKNCQGVS